MRATGIIRRIDDLGRIVIPKEVRRTSGIKEGDPLELYLTPEGGIVFQKYELDLSKEVKNLCNRITEYSTDWEYNATIDSLFNQIIEAMEKHEKKNE